MIETTNLPEVLAEVSDKLVEMDVPVDEMHDSGDTRFEDLAEAMGEIALIGALTGNLQFSHVASLAFFQAVSQEDPQERREELVKLAAVVVAWIGAIEKA